MSEAKKEELAKKTEKAVFFKTTKETIDSDFIPVEPGQLAHVTGFINRLVENDTPDKMEVTMRSLARYKGPYHIKLSTYFLINDPDLWE